MNAAKLKRYAELKEQIALFESYLETLKEEVIAHVIEKGEPTATGGATLESDYGTFSVQKRKSWKYSEKVDKLNTELKAEKAKEEINGKATATESDVLVFKS